jgi:glycosyltransferase involved in cell wall biosynthesis
MPRAAYFQLRSSYFGRAFDDGPIRALLACGYDVDIFSPEGALPQTIYPANVRRLEVEYRRSWLQSNFGLSRRYDLFLGTSDIPMAFAGVLAAAGRRPSVVASDEIFLGDYSGEAFLYWKSLTRWAMRRANFTIITDVLRAPLQREYIGLEREHRFVDYPCCYAYPYPGRSREEARRALGVQGDVFLVSFTGTLTEQNGAHWMIRLLDQLDPSIQFLVQSGGMPDPVTDAFMRRLHREGRVLYAPERVSWAEAAEISIAADASLAFYLANKPDFQNLGASSTKLCTSLWIGVPVIATWQPSFAFIDDLRCGITVRSEGELPAAVARMRAGRDTLAANTGRAIAERIRPAEHLRALEEAFRSL